MAEQESTSREKQGGNPGSNPLRKKKPPRTWGAVPGRKVPVRGPFKSVRGPPDTKKMGKGNGRPNQKKGVSGIRRGKKGGGPHWGESVHERFRKHPNKRRKTFTARGGKREFRKGEEAVWIPGKKTMMSGKKKGCHEGGK